MKSRFKVGDLVEAKYGKYNFKREVGIITRVSMYKLENVELVEVFWISRNIKRETSPALITKVEKV